jgi:hypothetical protein
MTFTIEITDSSHLAGITAAREAYNASQPEGSESLLAADADYVQFVMAGAAESYSKQYNL